MDFKGPVGWQAPVGPLSIVDDHSRYAITLYGTWSSRAEPVKERLEEAFERCGVPEAMLMDHGTPWWNMKAATGWTWLTVWIVKQGIRVHFSGYRHPQTQGKVERFHGSVEVATQRRGWPWGRRMGAAGPLGGTHPGVLLPKFGARTRPLPPAVHGRGPLVGRKPRTGQSC